MEEVLGSSLAHRLLPRPLVQGNLPAQQTTASGAPLHSHLCTLLHKYHHGRNLQLMMDTGLKDLEECWVALEVVHPVQGLEVALRMPGHAF